jgi:replicative DNA helicase
MAVLSETPVPGPDVWTLAKDLRPDDVVFDHLGAPQRVTSVRTFIPSTDCYEIRFTDGSSIAGDASTRLVLIDKVGQHQRARLTYKHKHKLRFVERTLQELFDGPLRAPRMNESLYRLPPPVVIQYPARDLPVPPYVLGYWLGARTAVKGHILALDRDIQAIRKRVRPSGYDIVEVRHHHRRPTLEFRPDPKHSFMFAGLEPPQMVPFSYVHSSIEQRQELFDGLMDSKAFKWTKEFNYWSYCSKILVEIRHIQALLESMGYKTTLAHSKKRKTYVLSFRMRKNAYRYIESVKKITKKECTFIQTERPVVVAEGFISVC